ncbi:P2X purinoceptor 7-like [Ptychodera flava]|uniref:P2X purinoceptor 7-like n=1 Tax=Ptychodera flava TaxID=63121 RepID=UPI00396AA1BD
MVDVEADIAQRKATLQAMISKMSSEEKDNLILEMVERNPSMVFDLVKTPAPQQGYHPPPSANQPSWCICSHCREMPTLPERKCCNKQPEFCISEITVLRQVCLDDTILAISRAYRNDMLATQDDDDFNKSNRHAAYRMFILWQYGRLGAGDRRVIPSCCTWKIRDKYPDQFGQYTGFLPSRFA